MAKETVRKPDVSVVVVIYNIAREAPRTLHSLSAAYQRHIDPDDYEVIVVDNGSNPPLDPHLVASLEGNFRLIRIDPASPSPAQAVNRGIAEANGKIIGVMIDGARIVTPGLLHFARHGARLYPTAIVATLGWYLGYDFQRWSMRYGYNQAREDALLASIRWPEDGYRLFEIATLDESSVEGWFFPVAESNALFMRRELWAQLGGVEERFDVPGGGLLSLDTLTRALGLPAAQAVIPLGEGSFHQLHGGIATNQAVEDMGSSFERWNDQYEQIRGHRFEWTLAKSPVFIGTLPRGVLVHFAHAAMSPVRADREPPLGRNFDRDLWSLEPTARPADARIAALVDMAQDEFRAGRYVTAVAVARLIRERAPDEPESQRLLSLVAAGLVLGVPSQHAAAHHLALAEAHRLLGEKDAAASSYQMAISLDPSLASRRLTFTKKMTRDLYLDLLIKILPNTIYGDPSTNPINRGPYRAELRREGHDWPAVAHTMVGVRRLENVRDLAQRAIDENIPGDFIETGVWRGGCCILMRGVLAANAVTNRKVYAADSFAGLPPPNVQHYPQDAGLDLHEHSALAISLEQVKDNFRRYGLLDEQVVFVQGLFQDTLPSLPAGPFSLIRLDGDLYESTHVALEALYPKLSPGGFVIVDDFKLIMPCQDAVIDYRTRMGITATMHDIDWNSIWWQKE